jgi:flavin reductase (DIM6/NTAB) family NADH-FMN oxidoreductase RutF
MPIDATAFRQTLAQFASGVTVVTMSDGEKQSGLTVSAFCSVSLAPPYILVCIDEQSQNLALLRASRRFGVNILNSDQSALSTHFAKKSEDKLANIPHHTGTLGVPLLSEAMAALECTVVQEVPAGDHALFIGQIESAEISEKRNPLLYYQGKYGHFLPFGETQSPK